MSKKNKYPFVVGDIIKGKKDNGYAFTNEDMTKAKVVSVGENLMAIKVVAHKDSLRVGQEFDVCNGLSDFDYFYPFKKGDIICGTEKSDYKYSITDSSMTKGVVIAVKEDLMRVKILKYSDEDFKYAEFGVENSLEYFKPYSSKPEIVIDTFAPVVHDPNSGITITTDHVKNVTVAYEDYKAEANCNLDCGDKFNYEFGLGLALERLGKKLQEENGSKPVARKVKITYLWSIYDDGCGLSVGDIVDALEFDDYGGVYVPCKKSTWSGQSVGKKYSFPVQYLSESQYELIEDADIWKKSDKPTKYVRVLNIADWLTEESGIKKGDVVEVLDDYENDIFVKAPKKNFFFLRTSNVHTDYFTYLLRGDSADWEYVTK